MGGFVLWNLYSPLFAYIDELLSGDALHISRIYLSIGRLSGICTCLLLDMRYPPGKLPQPARLPCLVANYLNNTSSEQNHFTLTD